jgi:DNA-binding MarR family transcriptional regulator
MRVMRNESRIPTAPGLDVRMQELWNSFPYVETVLGDRRGLQVVVPVVSGAMNRQFELVSTIFPLVEAIRKMIARVEALWADAGLSPSEGSVLARLFIDEDGRARSGDLLGHPIRSTPALGKVLASLESKEMITRRRGTQDRRVVFVEGTDSGRAVSDDVMERILAEVVAPATVDLDAEDLSALRMITSRFRPPEFSDS